MHRNESGSRASRRRAGRGAVSGRRQDRLRRQGRRGDVRVDGAQPRIRPRFDVRAARPGSILRALPVRARRHFPEKGKAAAPARGREAAVHPPAQDCGSPARSAVLREGAVVSGRGGAVRAAARAQRLPRAPRAAAVRRVRVRLQIPGGAVRAGPGTAVHARVRRRDLRAGLRRVSRARDPAFLHHLLRVLPVALQGGQTRCAGVAARARERHCRRHPARRGDVLEAAEPRAARRADRALVLVAPKMARRIRARRGERGGGLRVLRRDRAQRRRVQLPGRRPQDVLHRVSLRRIERQRLGS